MFIQNGKTHINMDNVFRIEESESDTLAKRDNGTWYESYVGGEDSFKGLVVKIFYIGIEQDYTIFYMEDAVNFLLIYRAYCSPKTLNDVIKADKAL